MKPGDLGALILLGALWGSSFLFIRVAAPVLGPFVLMDVRVGLAVVALSLYAVVVSRLPKLRFRWKEFLTIGALNAVWIAEELTARKILGLLMGILGVTVLVGWDPIPLNGIVLLSVGASLLAAFSYALGGVYAKRTFAGMPSLAMAIGQQMGAAMLLLPLAAVTLPPEPLPLPAALSALALALLCTAVAYLLYFRLIANFGPTKTLTVTFLSPVFGLLFGVLLLGEPVGIGTFLGLGIILSSVALVTGIGSFGKRKEEKPA
jgi:drug/metabolite transporter (DMT)-like permease